MHIGITEAGTPKNGKIKSAIGLGALLLEGIGDTMRVSLTADPKEEVEFAIDILKNLGLRKSAIDVVSCPTCGRTRIDLQGLAMEVEQKLAPLEKELQRQGLEGIKEADFGVAGGDGKGLIFAKGEIIKTVSEESLADELMDMIEKHFREYFG